MECSSGRKGTEVIQFTSALLNVPCCNLAGVSYTDPSSSYLAYAKICPNLQAKLGWRKLNKRLEDPYRRRLISLLELFALDKLRKPGHDGQDSEMSKPRANSGRVLDKVELGHWDCENSLAGADRRALLVARGAGWL